MKAYIGYIKDTNKKTMCVLSVTNDKGVILHNSKKIIEVDTARFETDLISLNWGISKIKKLMQNNELPKDSLTVFIANKTVYGWLDKKLAPLEFMPIMGDILLELSFMDCGSEIILSSLVDNKLKLAYKKLSKENKGTKVSELFKDK